MSTVAFSKAKIVHVHRADVRVLQIKVLRISEDFITLQVDFQNVATSQLSRHEILTYRVARHYIGINYNYTQLYLFYIGAIFRTAHDEHV